MADSSLKTPNQGDVHADELFDLENRVNAPDTPADLAAQDQRDAAMRDSGVNQNTIRNREEEGSSSKDTGWKYKPGKVSKARRKATGNILKRNRKKLIAGLGIGGGVGAIIALVMMILPLKLEMFAQNIMKDAMKVPGYAIQERGKQLIKKALMDRIFQVGTGTAEKDLLMCKGGGIACSVLKTYTTDLIEKKFDLKFDKSGTNGVKIRQIGGSKKTWEIKSLSGDGYGEISKTLDETEMRGFINKHIDERVSERGLLGWVKRFIARKVEMRKYNVRSWLGEKIAKPGEKLADLSTKIRTQIIMNIFGRIDTRMGVWMLCFERTPIECEKSISKLSDDQLKSFLGDSKLTQDADKLETKDMQKAVAEAVNKAMADIQTRLKAAKGWVAAILAANLAAQIAGAFSNGTFDRVISDAVLGTYIAFGYGDNAGLFTNIEKLKAGDLDMANIEALSKLLDGAEKSPLMAYENGITNPSIATLFGGTTAYAAGSSSTSGVMCEQRFGQPATPLPAGQLVCDNQKVNQGLFTQQAEFLNNSPLGPLANLWNDTLGKVIGFATNLLSSPNIPNVLDPLGIQDKILEAINGSPAGQQAAQAFGSIISSTVLAVPNCTADATGDQLYTCYSGAGWGESNEQAANGQDPTDGTANGSGGQYLSPTQVAAITKEQDTNTPKPSYLASIFDPYTKGSLTQQFALMAPSNGVGLIGSLLNAPAAIMAGFSKPSFAASVSSTVANNPFNQVMYGYPAGSPVFDADPGNYTAESCKTMATNRVLEHVDGVPYPVYTTTDPCALEKTVVGGLLADAGVTDDPNSLKDPLTSGGSGGGASSTAGATIDMAHVYEDSSNVACAAGTGDQLTFNETGYSNGGAIPVKLCSLPGTSYHDSDQPWGAITVVNSRASGAFNAMLNSMRQDLGMSDIGFASSFRTYAMQEQMKAQYGGGAADPGYSNHQMGLALDFYDPSACSNSYGISSCPSSRIWNWLQANAGRFGFSQYPPEWWHWSVDGR